MSVAVTNPIDTNSELYLHPSDASSLTLVSKTFDGTGFKSWKKSMLRALSAKNKTGFVTGRCERPAEDSPLLLVWIRCNDLVGTWLVNAVSKTIGESIEHFELAKEMWDDLEFRFGQSSGKDLFNVQKAICDITQSPDGLAGYYTRIKKLWDEMSEIQVIPNCTCGASDAIRKYNENQKLVQFLKGLDSDYKASSNNILMIRPLPTVSEAYGMLMQQESQSTVPSKVPQFIPEASSFQVRNFNQRNTHGNQPHMSHLQNGQQQYTQIVGQGGQNFHRPPSFGRGRGDFKRSNLFCDHCKRSGHHISKCYKLHGYPSDPKNSKGKGIANCAQTEGDADTVVSEGNFLTGSTTRSEQASNLSGLTQEQCNQLLSFLMKSSTQNQQHTANMVVSKGMASSSECLGSTKFSNCSCLFSQQNSSVTWIIDSGASDHMSHNASLFMQMNTLPRPFHITLPNGSTVAVTHTGNVKISQEITLTDVLFVPTFKYNLISIQKFTEQMHCQVVFTPKYCILQELSKEDQTNSW